MRRILKTGLIIFGISLVCMIIISMIISMIWTSFPVDLSKVTKIELIESADGVDGKDKVFQLEGEELKGFLRYFKKTKGIGDVPSCPFGLPIIFYEGNLKIAMDLGTDSCKMIRFGKNVTD